MHTITSKSGKTITLRPPTLADTQIMLDYINTIGREDIYVNVNPNDLYTFEQEQKFVSDIIKKIKYRQQVYYLAFHHNLLIGSCSISKGQRRRKRIGIFGITLSKDFRSDGIGRRLSEYTIKNSHDLLNLKIITLTVFAANQPAIDMYQKLGFKQYGLLPRGLSYQDGYIDEVMMYKNL